MKKDREFKKEFFRCSACNEICPYKEINFVAWGAKAITKYTTNVAFCNSCAIQKRSEETGKQLYQRLRYKNNII